MTYDGLGDRLTVPTTVTGNAGLTGSTAYGYDARGRLLSETSAGTAWTAKTNVYDAADNPTTLRSTAGLAYNANNQRTADTFDGNGNPTTYSGTTFGYNSDNQLTAVGTALTANYGADGLRAWKANSGGTKTYFLYDGLNPVCEYNAAGTITSLNIFGANGLISRTTSTTTAFYTFDANGNTAQRTDATGAVTSTESYDAYGTRTTSLVDPFGYGAQSGYYTDSETGLVLCGHRYYDPAKARWVTRDPISYAGGINLYGYCGDGPVGAADPSGYCHKHGQPKEGAAMVVAPLLSRTLLRAGVTAVVVGGGPEDPVGDAIAGGLWVFAGGVWVWEQYQQAHPSPDINLANEADDKVAQPGEGSEWIKMKGNQGWKDADGNFWKKDLLHKDHWDVSDRNGNKVREIDFDGNQIWPNGPKNKNKG